MAQPSVKVEEVSCPGCGKDILEKSKSEELVGTVLKSKLVFLNENGEVLAKCSACKRIVPLPIRFSANSDFQEKL